MHSHGAPRMLSPFLWVHTNFAQVDVEGLHFWVSFILSGSYTLSASFSQRFSQPRGEGFDGALPFRAECSKGHICSSKGTRGIAYGNMAHSQFHYFLFYSKESVCVCACVRARERQREQESCSILFELMPYLLLTTENQRMWAIWGTWSSN